jgi:hypothetical protein
MTLPRLENHFQRILSDCAGPRANSRHELLSGWTVPRS